ncbi:thiamine phosphate synthase [Paenibacillus rigui]|uniref:Thiamine phosphate synthase n=1 Tax=Paenibacillus rigui TaxID=554312 RepID=A0A229UM09_9BACL|nr:thiamine phosphate synthase [Paenibacillus rigui]OXM84412.1 thiamine phosphate synthase [Paenibacillus rigui]
MSSRKHQLHVITTGKQELPQLKELFEGCPTELIDVLHIREKQRGAREVAEWYLGLEPYFPLSSIYINDRLDAALAVGAPGVQLGYTSLSVRASRGLLPSGVRIGCSVHSREEAAQAVEEGPDYVLFGHIFASGSKPGLEPRGLDALEAIVQACPLPVIAIGGMEPERVEEVAATGCAGIAVLSSILLHDRPAEQIVRFREALDRTHYIPRRRFP